VTTAFASVPVLSVPQRQGTGDEPMRTLMARAHEMERDPRVLAVTLAGGFCYSDVPRAGMTAVVSTIGDPDLATQLATELRDAIWAQRAGFVQKNLSVADAVRQARLNESGKPAMLVDVADNIGGGSPGDGTAILAELIAQQATGVAIAIADPEAVALAFSAGVNGHFSGLVGGKTDNLHGDPVQVEGRVRLLSDGQFVYRGSYMTGLVREMGRSAVIDTGGNYLLLNELKTMPFDAEQLRSVGISPEYCRAIVVKSATAWRAAYGDLAGLVMLVDTPGICTVDLASLPYQHLTRPIYPLDPESGIDLPEVALS
jgi:microcystin degradation protein MlrC